MATARLINGVETAAGTTYEVDTFPFDQPPFGGPDGRDWDAFVVEPGGEASFEWREADDYMEEDDQYLHDAIGCLDLPRWARTGRAGSGGPGSGFDAAVLILDAGKTLDDLAAYLAKRVMEKGAP